MEHNTSDHNRLRAGAILFVIIVLLIEHPSNIGAVVADVLWSLFIYFLAAMAMYVVIGIYQDVHRDD